MIKNDINHVLNVSFIETWNSIYKITIKHDNNMNSITFQNGLKWFTSILCVLE